jgi:hypothetical protein
MVSLVMAIALGLVLVGCTASPPRSDINIADIQGKASPETAMFVARQTPLMVSLMVSPDELAAIDASTIAHGRSPLSPAQITRSLLNETQLDYNRDIRPWIGDELTLAVTSFDLDRQPANGQQPGYLLVMNSRDLERSQQFVQQLWKKQAIAGADLVFEQYAGVTITTNASNVLQSGETLATAIVDRFVLLANHPKVLYQALNTLQVANLSLVNDERYQTALAGNPTTNHIALAVMNLPQAIEGLLALDEPTEPLPTFTHLVAGLQLTSAGLMLDAAFLPAAGQPMAIAQPLLSAPIGALQYIPANSSAAAAGMDVSNSWQRFTQGLIGYPHRWLDQGIATLQETWGVDLSELVLPALHGEYAIALLPTSTPAPTVQDWIVVAQTSPDLDELLTELDAIATSQGLSLGRFDINGRSVSTWAKLSLSDDQPPHLNAIAQGVYTSVENYTLFASSLTALQSALSNRSLLQTAVFQQAIGAFRTPNDGYLYLDWPTLQGAIAQKIPVLSFLDRLDLPLVSDVTSVTLSSYGNDGNAQRGSALLRFE